MSAIEMPAGALLKVLGPNRESIHGGKGAWEPGDWMPEISPVRLCSSGYHLIEPYALPEWWRADATLWLAEGRGLTDKGSDGKAAFGEARLVRELHNPTEGELRLLACDFAEHVLPIWHKAYPDDNRPDAAIAAVRAYIADPTEEIRAAWDAAQDAAWAAERQWQSLPIWRVINR